MPMGWVVVFKVMTWNVENLFRPGGAWRAERGFRRPVWPDRTYLAWVHGLYGIAVCA
jgi:hypothetical protein